MPPIQDTDYEYEGLDYGLIMILNRLALKSGGDGVFMIPLSRIFTIIIEDWDNGGGDGSIEWVEQFLPLELHLKWKRRNGNHFAMPWIKR